LFPRARPTSKVWAKNRRAIGARGLVSDIADFYSLTEGDLKPLERFAEKKIPKYYESISAHRVWIYQDLSTASASATSAKKQQSL